MNDLETRLAEALKADAPPARDPMFRIQLMVRREQGAARRRLVRGGAVALAGGVLGALGVAAAGGLAGPERVVATAMVGAVVAAALAAHHLDAMSALKGLAQRWRTAAPLRLW